jgi:hypothetical protein
VPVAGRIRVCLPAKPEKRYYSRQFRVIWESGTVVHAAAIAFLKNRVGFTATVEGRFAAVQRHHIAAFAIMRSPRSTSCAIDLVWPGFSEFFWLAVLRRPGLSAALSLVMLVVLILLPTKHDILRFGSFVDVTIIDAETFVLDDGVLRPPPRHCRCVPGRKGASSCFGD